MSRPPPTFGAALQRRTRVMPFEVAIWAVAVGAGIFFPRYSPLWNEIATKGTDKKAWNDLTARMKSVLTEFGREFAPDAQAVA